MVVEGSSATLIGQLSCGKEQRLHPTTRRSRDAFGRQSATGSTRFGATLGEAPTPRSHRKYSARARLPTPWLDENELRNFQLMFVRQPQHRFSSRRRQDSRLPSVPAAVRLSPGGSGVGPTPTTSSFAGSVLWLKSSAARLDRTEGPRYVRNCRTPPMVSVRGNVEVRVAHLRAAVSISLLLIEVSCTLKVPTPATTLPLLLRPALRSQPKSLIHSLPDKLRREIRSRATRDSPMRSRHCTQRRAGRRIALRQPSVDGESTLSGHPQQFFQAGALRRSPPFTRPRLRRQRPLRSLSLLRPLPANGRRRATWRCSRCPPSSCPGNCS